MMGDGNLWDFPAVPSSTAKRQTSPTPAILSQCNYHDAKLRQSARKQLQQEIEHISLAHQAD